MNKDELIAYIQSVIKSRYKGNQALFAEDKGISAAYVNDILKGRRDPGKKILDALDIEKVVRYKIIFSNED